ncbi:hypothetical protein PVAND_010724 [Polypedilum vanderplanki]|uniref:Uncharacterized protein n=1 Tax=Polypedilum vanderplanki TaxID=319348 RepID=A0A9J6CGG7_POLVA|nr:hypothetical protein PVAND_010724 [Polypedilum vanderplanki]
MSEKQPPNNDDGVENEITTTDDPSKSLLEISLQYDELNYGELEQSMDMPAFEFSSPISSISSNCSSPDRTVQQEATEEDFHMNDSSEFVSLEELKSQISPPSDDDDDCSAATLTRKSILETIYEDIYLETPPGSPSTSSILPKRRRRVVRTDLSKCDEFKENVQKNLNL